MSILSRCLFALLLSSAVATAAAELRPSCWIISDMSGPTTIKDSNYKIETDRFSQPITLLLNGDNSSATGDSIRLHQVDHHMAIGFNKTATFTTNESYLIDPEIGVSIYTKAVSVKGIMQGLTGARVFIGKAKQCR